MTQIVMPDAHQRRRPASCSAAIMMQWIDVCAGVAAMRHAGGAVVTASIDRLDFMSTRSTSARSSCCRRRSTSRANLDGGRLPRRDRGHALARAPLHHQGVPDVRRGRCERPAAAGAAWLELDDDDRRRQAEAGAAAPSVCARPGGCRDRQSIVGWGHVRSTRRRSRALPPGHVARSTSTALARRPRVGRDPDRPRAACSRVIERRPAGATRDRARRARAHRRDPRVLDKYARDGRRRVRARSRRRPTAVWDCVDRRGTRRSVMAPAPARSPASAEVEIVRVERRPPPLRRRRRRRITSRSRRRSARFLDYTKGCYVGQEPVFRVYSQGKRRGAARAA